MMHTYQEIEQLWFELLKTNKVSITRTDNGLSINDGKNTNVIRIDSLRSLNNLSRKR